MMGPYYYYDNTYIEDYMEPPADSIQSSHECMWSGECCCQQATRLTFSVVTNAASVVAASAAAAAVTTAITAPTLATTGNATVATTTTATTAATATTTTTTSTAAATAIATNTPAATIIATATACTPVTPKVEKPTRGKSKKATSTTSSSMDNKKLRHREVEKNRHRQLQAMVKTLSERIPGRLDKETQVQTMKRAARYFIYLRTITQGHSTIPKDKLEKLYMRACGNVELIMSRLLPGLAD